MGLVRITVIAEPRRVPDIIRVAAVLGHVQVVRFMVCAIRQVHVLQMFHVIRVITLPEQRVRHVRRGVHALGVKHSRFAQHLVRRDNTWTGIRVNHVRRHQIHPVQHRVQQPKQTNYRFRYPTVHARVRREPRHVMVTIPAGRAERVVLIHAPDVHRMAVVIHVRRRRAVVTPDITV